MAAALGAFEPAWDRLVADAPLPSPFLRSWWLHACSTPASTFVLVVEDGELLGGVFVCRQSWLRANRLTIDAGGRLAPDHLDLVAASTRHADVVIAVDRWFREQGPCIVEVHGAAERAFIARTLPGWVSAQQIAPAPYATLPADGAAYLRSRPSWLRHTIDRASKRLERDGIAYRVVTDGTDVERALRDLHRLHEQRWGPSTNFLAGFELFADAARAGVRRGEMSIHELVAPDGVVASMATFELGGRVSFYQSGRSTEHQWRSAGTVLMARVMGRACDIGMREFDFLRGGEPYKEAWATGVRDVVRIRAAVGPWPKALMLVLSVRDRLRAAAARARRRHAAT